MYLTIYFLPQILLEYKLIDGKVVTNKFTFISLNSGWHTVSTQLILAKWANYSESQGG